MNLNIERKEHLSSIIIPGVDDLTIEVRKYLRVLGVEVEEVEPDAE